MKAASFSRFGGPEVLSIVDVPEPHAGPGQIRVAVRAAGVSPTDVKIRSGAMGGSLPQMVGRDVAGVVDEIGSDVGGVGGVGGVSSGGGGGVGGGVGGDGGVAVGDRVFGFSDDGAGAAEFALVSHYARIPASLGFAEAAALPVALETATRSLDALGVRAGSTLLVNGAAGAIGSTAVQLALARGARVIGTASAGNHAYLRSLGAEPVTYGEDLVANVLARLPRGVDRALDVAGIGALPDLMKLAGGAEHVVTISDVAGAREHGVRFSTGEDGRAFHALADIGSLIESGRFSLPVAGTFPLADIAEAHRVSAAGHVRGRLVLLVA